MVATMNWRRAALRIQVDNHQRTQRSGGSSLTDAHKLNRLRQRNATIAIERRNDEERKYGSWRIGFEDPEMEEEGKLADWGDERMVCQPFSKK